MDIYLTCIHDRHTDDFYRSFYTVRDAENFIRAMWVHHKWGVYDEPLQNNYGDACLYLSDDYYMFYQKISLG